MTAFLKGGKVMPRSGTRRQYVASEDRNILKWDSGHGIDHSIEHQIFSDQNSIQ
jgi:hypothetical protein